jgi:CDP-glucose 4,6-dehydratase
MNAAFWKGRRVFLTGHTGFKGSWLSLWLQDLGASLTGYSLPPPTQPSLFEIAFVRDGMRSITGEILDFEHLRGALRDSRPEIVFHLAAQSLVRASYADPVRTYAVNVLGTAHLLEAVREIPSVQAVVVVTSDKCYQNRSFARPYREEDSLGGNDPYSSSKACAELVTAAYRQSFFALGTQANLGVASARAGNVIGGGDWARDRLIPDAIRAALANNALLVRNPHAVRPWQHVLDPLAGYLTVAERLCENPRRFSEAWNFGPDAANNSPSVISILERLQTLWGPGLSWRSDNGAHPPEAHSLHLDSAKARAALGWLPLWNLDTALEATVRWYKAYEANRHIRAVTIDQIRAYQSQLVALEASVR